MEITRIPVSDGSIAVTRFGNGPKTLVAVHGILGSLMTWTPLAQALPDDWSLVAMDLGGHGLSRDLPGPYGLDRHAADVATVLDALDLGPDTVLLGHSMGATIAALVAAQRQVDKVVLVDGGLPLSLPVGAAPEAALELAFGAAIGRLGQTFPTEEAYIEFFLSHPVFAGWRTWGSERYARYDAVETPEGYRSSVLEEAVRQDGLWLVTGGGPISDALEKVTAPLHLLRASRGRMNEPGGMLSESAVRDRQLVLPRLRDELLDDCNHYSIIFDARCVARIAEVVTARD
jgi:pimeloyl-ACP methyl ester carboxylesterase